MTARIDWTRTPHDLGTAVIKYGNDLIFEGLVSYMQDKGPQIAEQMKREAGWTDRTGQARRELRTEVEVEGTTVVLYLITGAPHGQYLELRWGGRYAIVSPTIPRAGIDIANDLKVKMAS